MPSEVLMYCQSCKQCQLFARLTDQGVNFESHLFKHLCSLLGTDKLHTSTYHLAGNGITERPNKTIKPNLAKFVNDTHDDWDLCLQLAISAYNNSYHSTIKITPFEAMFGRPSVLVSDVLLANKLPADTKLKDVSEFIKVLRMNADYVSALIGNHTNEAQQRQKKNYDRFVKNNDAYNIGDTVKINNFRIRPGSSKAFEPKFLGPYMVTAFLGDLNYRLESPNLKPEVVHYNRMLHYRAREGNPPVIQAQHKSKPSQSPPMSI